MRLQHGIQLRQADLRFLCKGLTTCLAHQLFCKTDAQNRSKPYHRRYKYSLGVTQSPLFHSYRLSIGLPAHLECRFVLSERRSMYDEIFIHAQLTRVL